MMAFNKSATMIAVCLFEIKSASLTNQAIVFSQMSRLLFLNENGVALPITMGTRQNLPFLSLFLVIEDNFRGRNVFVRTDI